MKQCFVSRPYCSEFNDMERFTMILSPRSAHLLTVLKDPLRLQILLELERQPRSATELARDALLRKRARLAAMFGLATAQPATTPAAMPAPAAPRP